MMNADIGSELRANGWDEATGHANEGTLIDSRLTGLEYLHRRIGRVHVYVAELDKGHVVLMNQGYDSPAKPTDPQRTLKDAMNDTVEALNRLAMEYGDITVYNIGRAELGAIVLDGPGIDAELAKYNYKLYDYSTEGDLGQSRLAKIKYEEDVTKDGIKVFVGKTPGIRLVLTDSSIENSDFLGDLMNKYTGDDGIECKHVPLQKQSLDQILGAKRR